MRAEILTGSYFLADTVDELSEAKLTVDNLDASKQVPLRAIVWADTRNRERFESCLDEDPTVAEYEHLVTIDGRERYSIEYAQDARDIQLYRGLVENGATVSYAAREPDNDGWLVHYTFPDRSRFTVFEELCTELGVELNINTVDRPGAPDWNERNTLTVEQCEALVKALETGYFDIPRKRTLAEIGDELGISRQAVSERLRRGQRRLIRQRLIGSDND